MRIQPKHGMVVVGTATALCCFAAGIVVSEIERRSQIDEAMIRLFRKKPEMPSVIYVKNPPIYSKGRSPGPILYWH